MRNIGLAFGRLMEARHKIDAITIARSLVTHLRIDGMDDTLVDDVVRRSPNRNLIQILHLFLLSKFIKFLKEIATSLNCFGFVIWVIFMDLESTVRKPKSSDKLSLSGSELGVRCHPSDGLVRSKEASGIKLMDSSLVNIMLKCKRSSKTG